MSIWSSLYTATSGITAYGNAMGVVGDNVANANTVGFKGSRASFAAVLGGIGPSQQRVGAGVFMDAAEVGFGQGSLQQTGRASDMAIQGGGYFVVKGSHLGQEGTYYTRDGRFDMNDGFLEKQGGLRVQGYAYDPIRGEYSSTLTDLRMESFSPPEATTTANLKLHIPNDTSTTGQTVHKQSFTIYDSLGQDHTVELVLRSQGPGSNTWSWDGEVEGSVVGSGTLEFDTEGNLVNQSGGPLAPSFNGAAGMAINMNFDGSRQSNAGINLVPDVDGHGAGTMNEFEVAKDGQISGVYSNGTRRELGRLALASFGGESGLERTGNQLFGQTPDSGPPSIGAPGDAGRGAVFSGVVEGSNVDLGTELVTMITYQRAFQANARAVSAADEMLAETANLKR